MDKSAESMGFTQRAFQIASQKGLSDRYLVTGEGGCSFACLVVLLQLLQLAACHASGE